ncbi:MAG TPA: hypothetical protein VJJ02_04925 [Candidatus Paceibacterota bacterium]
MLTQVSREALERLVNELQQKDFTPSTINRLKNENPGYAHLANFFARKAKSELGDAGFRLALDQLAISYRVLELSERYPDARQLLSAPTEIDVLEMVTGEDAANALAETNEAIDRWRGPFPGQEDKA